MKKKEEVKAQYGRVKGAPWFPLLYKKDIMVLGQGGIGSWVSLFLSRAGTNLHIYDMDRYEDHNMTGQIVRTSDIGKLKTEAVRDIIKELSPDCEVEIYDKYTDESPTSDVVICGFDNMTARKVAFHNWKQLVQDYVGGEIGYKGEEKMCFFQDGRLLAEQLQIFNIPGDRPDLMEKYEKEWLFDDSEAPDADCTFKQTSHAAGMIASHMVGFVTNWITNANAEVAYRGVPFKYEYLISLNLTQNDFARL